MYRGLQLDHGAHDDYDPAAIDVGQFNGVYHYIHPFASPFIIIGGQGGSLRINSPNNVNASGHLAGIE